MVSVRHREQDLAAQVGQYAFVAQLGHPSSVPKEPGNPALAADLDALLALAKPKVIYTHNPADKHATHVGVFLAVLAALRRLPPKDRPRLVYGCEVWRDLDWMPDDAKVTLEVGGRDHLAAALMGVFDSQIAGGKRYDLGTFGRRRANATYLESHHADTAEQFTYAMDLTPLVRDERADPAAYVADLIQRFAAHVRKHLAP
jgi:LmbE family N-acetylglucosaminyl deacetylase